MLGPSLETQIVLFLSSLKQDDMMQQGQAKLTLH